MSNNEWITVSRWKGCKGRPKSRQEWREMLDYLCKKFIEYFGHADYICICCAKESDSRLGHVIPIRGGGLFTRQNLRLTCDECEHKTGNQILSIHSFMKKFHEWMNLQ